MSRRRDRDRRGNAVVKVLSNGIDIVGGVIDALPLLRFAGHIIILPFRIAAHFMP